jgi:hypothetical protein
VVAERIGDPGKAPAVFVGRLGSGDGTRGDRLAENRIGIIDNEQGAAGGAAGRLRVASFTSRSANSRPWS